MACHSEFYHASESVSRIFGLTLLIIGYYSEESFQAITCSGTKKTKNKFTKPNTKCSNAVCNIHKQKRKHKKP